MNRPRPALELLEPEPALFRPAPDVAEWLRATFIEPGGALANPDHEHLVGTELGVLWTNESATSKQLQVAGTAEIPVFRGHPWVKARQEQQIREWFGGLPDFVLTFWAPYAHWIDDARWCALVEHELYHCGVALDRWGNERFRRDGSPVWAIRGHDVEEFVGVVRRYGAAAGAGRTAELVEAAKVAPEVAEADLVGACGVCARAA